jgi:phosphoglycolate phosphatase-like HAD superfamily hydrolase
MKYSAVWAFDVDGTLVGALRSDRLRPGAGRLLAALASRGVTAVLWSAGGSDYAQRMAERHGIDHHFAAFYAKSDRDRSARYVVDHFDADHRPAVYVDDSPADLPLGARVVDVPPFIGNSDADRALFVVLDHLDRHLLAGAGHLP